MDKDFIKRFTAKLDESLQKVRDSRMEDDRRRLMSTIGQDLAKMLQPFLSEVASTAKSNKEGIREAMFEIMGTLNSREVKIDTAPIIGAIEAAFMGIEIPAPKVTVTVPPIRIPDIVMPDMQNMRGFMHLMANHHEVGYDNPLPVVLYDNKGNPLKMFDKVSSVIAGGNSGKMDFFTIKGFSASAFAELMNPDGRIKVELPTGGGGLTDTELRASSVPVAQASGAIWSTAVVEIFGSTAASMLNGDNRLRVAVDTGTSGLTDTELRASSVPVEQVSGSNWSIFATNPVNQGDAATALRVVIAGNSDASVAASQVGTWTISDITASLKAALVDSSGVQYSGSNPVPVTGTVTVASVTATIAAANVDSSGVQYSGSNPVPVTLISGALTSTISVGPTVADVADDGSAPVKRGGIARTANPTAVSGGDIVSASHDDLGRTLVRPVQVRDLTLTAYAQLTTGSETTLRAAVAGAYLDLIYLMGANNSDAAVSVDIRAVTGGGVVMTLMIPANGTAGIACPVPLPQQETGNNWTADMGDITGTTVSLTALFSQEV